MILRRSLFVSILILFAGQCRAEEAKPTVRLGDTVRITHWNLREVGVVEALNPRFISIRGADAIMPQRIPWGEVQRMEKSYELTAQQAAMRGGWYGLLSGIVLGAVIGIVSGEQNPDYCDAPFCFTYSPGEGAVFGAFIGGLVGWGIGAIIGLGIPGPGWEPVTVPAWPEATPDSTGAAYGP
jgi:hypothetical protein